MARRAFDKTKPGEVFRPIAAEHNAMIDAAVAHRVRAAESERREPPPVGQTIAYARNDSTGLVFPEPVIPQYGVVGLEDPLIDPADNEQQFRKTLMFSGQEATYASHRGRFGIALEPIPRGKIARVCVAGVTQARLYIASAGTYARADVKTTGTGFRYLTPHANGAAEILWHENDTGEVWSIIRLGEKRGARMFPVTLTQTGGSVGDLSNPASWTYTVADAIFGTTLGTGVDPTASPHKWQRPSVGQMLAATYGLAHYEDDGDLVLTWINEMIDMGAC